MRISGLSINNFRSVQDLETELSQICALVGPNNSGKSNILMAIQYVFGKDWVSVSSFNEDDVYSRDPDKDIFISLTLAPPVLYRKFKSSDPVEIHSLSFEFTRYKRNPNKGSRRLEQKCHNESGGDVYIPVNAPKRGIKTDFVPLVGIPSEVRKEIPLIYIGTNRSLKDHLPRARFSLLRQLLEDINTDFHSPDQTVSIKQRDGSEKEMQKSDRFQQLIKRAMKLLRTDDFINLENSIKRNALRQLGFDPDVDADKLDFFFSPFDTMEFYKSLDLRVREGDFDISATELGEGVQNALVLSILQAFEERRKEGAILLIEEPEMFLHPQMQRSLYKTLRTIGKTNQIIYTTHSPHFVSVPQYHEVLLVRKDNGGTKVNSSGLPTNARRREKLIKELDPERNELFFATRLLLVEGDTEKLALPEYAKKLGLDLDRAGATIVEVSGKRNLQEFADIAISFGIPTSILYNTDSSDFKNKKEEEKEFNDKLEAYAESNYDTCVWSLEKNYENNLRRTFGEDKYQELCQSFPNVGKPTRARLIAMEDDLPIPEPFEEILNWLVNNQSD